MKKLSIIIIAAMTVLSSCQKKLDSLLQNPNGPDLNTANVDLLLNTVQLNFTGFFSGAEDFGGQLTRQQQWYGPLYNNGYTPSSFDGLWTTAYSGVIVNADKVIELAGPQKKYFQSGVAKMLKAYTYGTLVDCFGDVPYSEAAQGVNNLNPHVTPGVQVYAGVLTLLDSAISDFNKTGAAAGPTNDLYYAGNKTNWRKAAKTLKLKFLTQLRLVDNTVGAKIQALLTENDLITSTATDFEFKYGTNVSSPDARHPHYAANYLSGGTAGEFIANYFMWLVTASKTGGAVSSIDPRRRYYFYRQRTNYADVNQQSVSCAYETVPGHYPSVPSQTPFCLVGAGYWGRDHGDASGIPPDGQLRTAWGVYPAGGQFDANQGTSVSLSLGGRGAGIEPIWEYFFTSFLEAEIALKMGITTAGTPRALLEAGIRGSISKVINFPATIGVTVSASFVPTQSAIDNYVNNVLAEYDAAANDDVRLEVIMREYYIALWGNGMEAYNNYRRTGKPSNMQLVKTTATPGFFPRSHYYPSVFINRNLNAPAQKNIGAAANKVFWDNNPDNFCK
ncbi:MAG: SusD/RagB family nutrient-binding outer membrane lipoprotein [Sphingobacteriales bacterium]|nr:SusD/RagB family nutrient-binding outer membrane lipoprotein [Sphingobacteriales bacterium]